MIAVRYIVNAFRKRAREKRAQIFRASFAITRNTKILDLGSEDGSSIAAVLRGMAVSPKQVYIADIDAEIVGKGRERFGFIPTVIPESGTLPFDDGYFDIVYCSSVIEHVTVPKTRVWAIKSGREFRRAAQAQQLAFAQEIRRLGKRYFVQTPNRRFPIESHTWLPFVGYLPRNWQLRVLSVSNRFWVKRTNPDWHLLTISDMRRLFPDAAITSERFLGLSKSIMAIKR